MLHALRSVLGTVSTKGIAGCFALLLVRGYLAMYDARDPWLVVTNVQVFVGRSVLKATVNYVPRSKKTVLIFWR